jgi:hypothetical protein
MCIEIPESTVLEDCLENEVVYKIVRRKILLNNNCVYQSLFFNIERSPQTQLKIVGITKNSPKGKMLTYSIGKKTSSILDSPLIYCFSSLSNATYYVGNLIGVDDIFDLAYTVCILACKAEGKKFYGKLIPYGLETVNVQSVTPIEEILLNVCA